MKKSQGRERAALLEFHISRQARRRYGFENGLFATNGNVIFADFRAARSFAQKMNAGRDLADHPELTVRAGQINAMGLVDEILHQVVAEFLKQVNPAAMNMALDWVGARLDQKGVDAALLAFIDQFPPLEVLHGRLSPLEYLESEAVREDGVRVSNRELTLEELILLWLANENPAFKPFRELFDDSDFKQTTIYDKIFPELHRFFDTQPKFGPDQENLIDMLQAPAKMHPGSLAAQLDFMRRHWGGLIPKIMIRLLSSLDMIREEEKPVFGAGGQPQALVYEYHGPEYEVEEERFSQDVYWMPNLVLMAKNIYVWLDQLARKYAKPIERLDQVPDEELEILSRQGFTGLWLIGLWERSLASQTIKRLRGNPDAVASAYSLFSYEIAADLGGDEAYQVFREKAKRFNIRLASDMVPNHMGIDSGWMIEHPDWFIQLSYSPFPTYSFNGPNLSSDGRVGIYIEDHYFDNSDAAVVFKRTDHWTGDNRFIYHGNDGTSMPWNDTAQLNYLLPEVREAVIQTILHVARKFPIIRFDAAMTLAKKHFQRLWFPEPGTGGAIPSRAEYGMPRVDFDSAFPEEFWRMVVDRVALEAPDTLLLAEAFWLMEGYFVRTLGMHRVYNSAFMNMLRDEKNQEYRLVVKNTLEFDPQILKRFVNFMNNPDERTAVDQFGKGDKYFGICTMMVTMPGLPMFGHGQIEGYAEKYGMEFRYPKWHEQPDANLVDRHEREIFPLLRRRYLFAEVDHFRIYDFYLSSGAVNEDVFAYSNQAGEQRTLVVFHNRFADTRGWIKQSAAFLGKSDHSDERSLVQTTLAQALGLHQDPQTFTIFRDQVNELEYLLPNPALIEHGLYLELNAYRYHVFSDFREVKENPEHSYTSLSASLNGKGVPSIAEALREYELRKLLEPYRELVNPGMLGWLIQNRLGSADFKPDGIKKALHEADQKIKIMLVEMKKAVDGIGDLTGLRGRMIREIEALLRSASLKDLLSEKPKTTALKAPLELLLKGANGRFGLGEGGPEVWGAFLCILVTSRLGWISGEKDAADRGRNWIDEWLLGKVNAFALEGLGMGAQDARRSVELNRVMIHSMGWYRPDLGSQEQAHRLINLWMTDSAARRYLRVHPYEDVLWFNKEAFEELAWWSFALELIALKANPEITDPQFEKALQSCYRTYLALLNAAVDSGFQLDKLL